MYLSKKSRVSQSAPPVSPARELAYRILLRWAQTSSYVDHILSEMLGRANLSAADRSLVTEIVNGVVRWKGKLDWILSQLFRGDYARSSPKLQTILRLGLYQLLLLEKVPEYAAVSEAVLLAKKEAPAWGRLVNAVLRSYLREPDRIVFPRLEDDPVAAISVSQSHPEWLVRRWLRRLGLEETIRLCEANNRRPAVSVRVNLRRSSREEVADELRAMGISVSEGVIASFLRIEQAGDVQRLPAFIEGKLTVQDESAGLAVLLLAPEPGETVLDLCAAPGGKSTFLAELANEKARVVAVDRDLRRARLVRENSGRLRLQRIFVLVADARNFTARAVDRVLLDAPCSGLGVLAKRSDLRWRRSEAQIAELSKLQLELLENAAAQVRPGGVVVYSTCTIEPEENEEVIERFLTAHQNFELEPATNFVPKEFVDKEGFVRTYPHVHGMDGSFAARLRRKA
jgi:16S rRNA (cytosine967-C5)-methyltransferase